MPAIIERAKNKCSLVWLENLNLRGDYKKRILVWVHEKRPNLDGLYNVTYIQGDRSYWWELDEVIRYFTSALELPYVRNDDSMKRPFDAPPVVVNHFFHE